MPWFEVYFRDYGHRNFILGQSPKSDLLCAKPPNGIHIHLSTKLPYKLFCGVLENILCPIKPIIFF